MDQAVYEAEIQESSRLTLLKLSLDETDSGNSEQVKTQLAWCKRKEAGLPLGRQSGPGSLRGGNSRVQSSNST